MPRLDDGRVLAEARARAKANGVPVANGTGVRSATDRTQKFARETGGNATHAPVVARVEIVCLKNIAGRSVRWIWHAYLPLGKVVVVDGLPGQGKSTLLLDIIARLSTAAAMPDGSHGPDAPSSSLILSYEDDAGDTLRPRLEAAGADLSRVGVITGVSYNGDPELLPPSLPKDIEAIDQALTQRPDVRLVMIDPLSAAVDRDVDMHRDQDVRRPLARLARMASERGVCVALVRHVRKAHGGNAIYAGGGSVGISGQARLVMIVEQHPEDPASAVLAVAKSNLAEIPPSLTFRKVPATVPSDSGELIRTSRLEWTGTTNLSADELLLARGDGGPADQKDASDFLREMLAGGRIERTQVMRAAAAAGIPDRTVDRTAKRIGITRVSEGFGAEKRAYWSLSNGSIPATEGHSRQYPPLSGIGGNEKSGGNGDDSTKIVRALV